jgi:hypothetical protein
MWHVADIYCIGGCQEAKRGLAVCDKRDGKLFNITRVQPVVDRLTTLHVLCFCGPIHRREVMSAGSKSGLFHCGVVCVKTNRGRGRV